MSGARYFCQFVILFEHYSINHSSKRHFRSPRHSRGERKCRYSPTRQSQGLAVEADEEPLRRCAEVTSNATAKVIPVHLAVHPPTVLASLRPHIEMLFKDDGPVMDDGRLPLDVLVMDIDGCDCTIVEELLLSIRAIICALCY